MYKQPDSGSSGTINIRSAPFAKSSQRAILASARLAKPTMASSSSSRSNPKSRNRRTLSIFTVSIRTSFPSCRDLALSLYIERQISITHPLHPLRNLAKNLDRLFYRGQRLQGQPLAISESASALGCPIHNIGDLHVLQPAHTLRFADQICAGCAENLHVFRDVPLGCAAWSSV